MSKKRTWSRLRWAAFNRKKASQKAELARSASRSVARKTTLAVPPSMEPLYRAPHDAHHPPHRQESLSERYARTHHEHHAELPATPTLSQRFKGFFFKPEPHAPVAPPELHTAHSAQHAQVQPVHAANPAHATTSSHAAKAAPEKPVEKPAEKPVEHKIAHNISPKAETSVPAQDAKPKTSFFSRFSRAKPAEAAKVPVAPTVETKPADGSTPHKGKVAFHGETTESLLAKLAKPEQKAAELPKEAAKPSAEIPPNIPEAKVSVPAVNAAASSEKAVNEKHFFKRAAKPQKKATVPPTDATPATPKTPAKPTAAPPAMTPQEKLKSMVGLKKEKPKPADADVIADVLSQKKKKKPRRKLTHQSLQNYLNKAGYDVNAELLKQTVFRIVIGLFALLSVVVLVIAASYGATAGNILLFILALWTAVFAGMLLLVWSCVYFFLDYRVYQRTRELEDVLPDFLQLASSNIAAGMPIDRALWYAIRPNFGVLAKEMEEVAKATMAGEDLEVSLVRFTDKYDSVTLKRSVNILIEGLQAGGEMADLLNKIALNIEDMKIMQKEMAASVTTYAIFITFASVIIAPFLFGLATELLTIITKITGSLGSGTGSIMSLSKPDPDAIGNFKIYAVLMMIMSSMFSAAIVSTIKKGNIMDGIKSIPVYALIAVTIYFLSASLLHTMFAGII